MLLLEGVCDRATLLKVSCPAQLLVHLLPVGLLQCFNGCRETQQDTYDQGVPAWAHLEKPSQATDPALGASGSKICLCTSSSFPFALWATPTSQDYPKAPSAAKEINKWHPSLTRACSTGWRRAKLPLRPNSRLSSGTQVTRLLGQEGDRFLAEVRHLGEVGARDTSCFLLLPAAVAAASSARSRSFSCRSRSISRWWCLCSSSITCWCDDSISARLRSQASCHTGERTVRGKGEGCESGRHITTWCCIGTVGWDVRGRFRLRLEKVLH